MANINKIRLSGQTYDIQDQNATKTLELTQAEYDALTVKDPNTFYVITDAQGADLSNYYTKSETSGATQISTALASKQTTLTAGTNITIVDNVISATGGGGGKAIEAGRGITVTTGATADTVSVDLPISGDSNSNVYLGRSANYQDRYGSINFKAGSSNGIGSFNNQINYCTVFGWNNNLKNNYEFGCGIYNTSNTGSTNADKTLFSVGNGTAANARHNAFEIRQNGDIYLTKDGQDVKLQDQLGGGGSITIDTSLDSGSKNAVANSAITNAINSKQDSSKLPEYIVGDVTFSNNQVSVAKSMKYNGGGFYMTNNVITINNQAIFNNSNLTNLSLVETSAITTSINSSSTDAQVPSAKAVYDQLGGMKIVKLTESEYTALVTKDSNTLYVVVPDPSN